MVILLAVKMIVLIIVTNCFTSSWFPICIICFKSLGLPIPFILWYINAHKLIATHYCPGFCPNTTTSPWLYGAFIVFLGSTRCIQGTGFSLYHYRACSLYNFLCELHPWTHYMGNFTKGTLSIWDISFHVYLYLNCRHISLKS